MARKPNPLRFPDLPAVVGPFGALVQPANFDAPRGALTEAADFLNHCRRQIVERDDGRALEFDGVILAAAEEDERGAPVTEDTLVITRAAIYQTKGGKFIAEFSRYLPRQVVSWGRKGPPKLFDKAAVFGSLEDATGFFRPGRLTNALLDELGIKRTEFID